MKLYEIKLSCTTSYNVISMVLLQYKLIRVGNFIKLKGDLLLSEKSKFI